jgi:hypothetical protein
MMIEIVKRPLIQQVYETSDIMADRIIIPILPIAIGAIIEERRKPVRSPSKHAGNTRILKPDLQTGLRRIGKGNHILTK